MCCNRYPTAGYGGGYPVAGAGYGGFRPFNNFALIVVLFVLLIIVGRDRDRDEC